MYKLRYLGAGMRLTLANALNTKIVKDEDMPSINLEGLSESQRELVKYCETMTSIQHQNEFEIRELKDVIVKLVMKDLNTFKENRESEDQ